MIAVTDLCKTFSFHIMTGYCQHKEMYMYPWCEPIKTLQSIIDYIILKQQPTYKLMMYMTSREELNVSLHEKRFKYHENDDHLHHENCVLSIRLY